MHLHNTVIIITGASDGIGREIALRLAREGTRLALIARNSEKLEEVATESRKQGALDVRIYPSDIRDSASIRETIGKIHTDFGTIDILINNAGIWQKLSPLEDISPETIDDILDTNLRGLIHMTRAVLPFLKSKNTGIILNISSKSGVVAQAGQSVYTATKYGVRGFTEVLKEDLKGTRIRIAGVYQSGTDTDMFRKTGDTFSTEKFTNPNDLADVIAYILSTPDKLWLHEVRVDH